MHKLGPLCGCVALQNIREYVRTGPSIIVVPVVLLRHTAHGSELNWRHVSPFASAAMFLIPGFVLKPPLRFPSCRHTHTHTHMRCQKCPVKTVCGPAHSHISPSVHDRRRTLGPAKQIIPSNLDVPAARPQEVTAINIESNRTLL